VKRLWHLTTLVSIGRLTWWLYTYFAKFRHPVIPAYGPVEIALEQFAAIRRQHFLIGAVWLVVLLASIGMLVRQRFKAKSKGTPQAPSALGM